MNRLRPNYRYILKVKVSGAILNCLIKCLTTIGLNVVSTVKDLCREKYPINISQWDINAGSSQQDK